MLSEAGITGEELALAARNHGMPLEALRYDLTPAGLHYLLIHYDIPALDADTHLLTVNGAVEEPLSLSLEDLARMPQRTETVTLECAGNGRARLLPRPVSQPWLFEAVGTAAWSGVSVSDVLEAASPRADAAEVVFTGADRGVEGGVEQSYQRALSLAEARRREVTLATHMNGSPILPQHGAPLRLVVPGWYGMTSVKWLTGITLVTEPFTGYQHEEAYRVRKNEDEHGRSVDRIQPRSLILPPGIPDFFTRGRLVPSGEVALSGRAWSGFGAVVGVEISVDGGDTWHETRLRPPLAEHAWCGWDWAWQAQPGRYRIGSRAEDVTGRIQPLQPDWNLGGYEVNAVHWVDVEVR